MIDSRERRPQLALLDERDARREFKAMEQGASKGLTPHRCAFQTPPPPRHESLICNATTGLAAFVVVSRYQFDGELACWMVIAFTGCPGARALSARMLAYFKGAGCACPECRAPVLKCH